MCYQIKYSQLYSFIILISLALLGCGDDDDDDDGIDISGISFEGSTIEVKEGFSINLDEQINISGTDGDLAEISFLSADETIVSVSGNTLTAESVGTTTVTATEANTDLSATVTVNVIANVIAVTGVSLDNTTLDLKVGATSQLTATVTPEDATVKTLTWSVSLPAGRTKAETAAEDIATVSDAGLVTAISAGEVVVMVKTIDGEFTASTTITVTNIAVTGVTLDLTSLSVNIGETGQLIATITPADATNKNVGWSLTHIDGDPETYAIVDATTGVVTGVSECNACGLALVATTADGALTAMADVHVVKVLVTSVTLDPSSPFTLDVDETRQMEATILPANASDQTITWTIEEFDNGMCRTKAASPDKATVDENGIVTGEIPNDGCTGLRVVATSLDGPSANTEFTVNPILVTSVSIRDSDGLEIPGKILNIDGCSDLNFSLFTSALPSDATNNSFSWSVSVMSGGTFVSVNPSSGSVSITKNIIGVARITATANDGSGVSDYVDIDSGGCAG